MNEKKGKKEGRRRTRGNETKLRYYYSKRKTRETQTKPNQTTTGLNPTDAFPSNTNPPRLLYFFQLGDAADPLPAFFFHEGTPLEDDPLAFGLPTTGDRGEKEGLAGEKVGEAGE